MTSSDRPRIPPTVSPSAGAPLPPSSVVVRATDAGDEPPRRPPRRFRIGRALLWTFLTLLGLALVPPAAVIALRWVEPPTSAFMLRSEVQPVSYHWVPREQIPDSLRLAVVAAEDQKFWTHWGFDFIAIAEALEHNEKNRKKRGASTITQQTAKNLFLWPSRSWIRKGLEVTFTLLLEACWSKERILEVYLNIAEFGPGVYGAEAAAQKFFGKPARELSAAESARLAAVLPNPRKWRADRPGPYVQKRVDWILVHTGHAPHFSAAPADGEPPASPEAPPAGEPAVDADVQTTPLDSAPPLEPEAPAEGDEALSDDEDGDLADDAAVVEPAPVPSGSAGAGAPGETTEPPPPQP